MTVGQKTGWHVPWRALASEFAGTALVRVGLSLVIVMFGAGTFMARVVPSEEARRAMTGFLSARPAP